jgi:hypothetical protein
LASEVKPTATRLIDLDNEELKRWTILKDDYSDMKKDYDRKLKALGELDNYIESSVEKSNHSIIRDLTTTYEKLKALKEKLEPTSKQLRQSARVAYESAQKWNTRTKLELWLRTYRNAFLDDKKAQLPIVEDYYPHYDFFRAIAQANPACSSALHSIHVQKEQMDEDPPEFTASCLDFFESWQRSQPATQPGVTHTAFATLQGQPSQPNAQLSQPPQS